MLGASRLNEMFQRPWFGNDSGMSNGEKALWDLHQPRDFAKWQLERVNGNVRDRQSEWSGGTATEIS